MSQILDAGDHCQKNVNSGLGRVINCQKGGRTWNRLGIMGGAGGKTSPSSTSLRILNTFSLGAPTSGWVSWIFGNSSEIATRTGSSGRL